MSVFQIIPGASVVVSKKGAYSEAPLAAYDGRLFASVGRSYVRLEADSRTTDCSIRWIAIHGYDPATAKFGHPTPQAQLETV